MKKILLSITLWALLPAVALAAYNDVTLTATVITVSGGTVTVSGSSASVQSLVVGANSFDVTLLPASSITVTATGNKNMDLVAPGPITSTLTCNSSGNSTLALSNASSAVTITVTPSGTCGATAGTGGGVSDTGGGGPIVSSGGGGGGGGGWSPPVVPTKPPGLSEPQIQAILTLLASFGTDQKIIDSVTASLRGATPSGVAAGPGPTFSGEFGIGTDGPDVVALQTFLEGRGLLVIPPGIAHGHFGGLTRDALKAYQKSVGINATGYVGPLTRTAIAASR
jgi:peptidoglycan hydrolase-like protein with peptidoglycan-binding domain